MVDPKERWERSEGREGDFSQRVTFTYMIGVYLAVNAISDLYLLVEGPDCSYMKTQYVQGNHDWMSTLTSVSGFHRVANTALHPSQMGSSREEGIREVLLRMAGDASVPAIALTSMPMAFITGADYERLTRLVHKQTGKSAVHIPGKSLSGDWLDGYAETLLALASQVELQLEGQQDHRVAIVGYLWDRNEGDHEGNLRELRRIFDALGLELVSVWLDGSRFEDLARVAQAKTILSFPYGRKAAKKLARRTNARLIEMPLPFGFEDSERFVRRLGEAFACETQAEAFIDRQLSTIIPKLEWVVPFLFQNRRFAFVGEPHILPGFEGLVSMLGGELAYAVITNHPHHASTLRVGLEASCVLVYPKMKEMVRFLFGKARETDIHLLVTNNVGIMGAEGAIFEFGFPSSFRHALYDRPFLSFAGALAFVDSMANTMRMHEVELARRTMSMGLGKLLGH